MAGRPSAADHYAQAEENERFYRDVLGGLDTDERQWALIALFYVVVHATQAALVSKGIRPKDHKARMARLQEEWPKLADLYSTIYEFSRLVRYELREPTRNELAIRGELVLRMVRDEIRQYAPPPY